VAATESAAVTCTHTVGITIRELIAVDVDGSWGGAAHQARVNLPLAPPVVECNVVVTPLWEADLSWNPIGCTECEIVCESSMAGHRCEANRWCN
jgi:hypothetical protein